MKVRFERRQANVLGNVALVLLGVGLALGIVELVLRTFPNWVPGEVRVNPPARRVKAYIDETYDVRLSDGDLYRWMEGMIAPLPPDKDEVVAHVHMTTDAHGFRNAVPEKATYSIVALGDSFTRASGVATPWPQKLAEYIGGDVLNLGDVGFGPQDELNVLRRYGLRKQPQWIIMAYFEGNDLHDAASYELASPFILPRFGSHLLALGFEAWHASRSDEAQAAEGSAFRYPVTLTINEKDLETVFFPYYIAWLTLNREAIELSENFRVVKETLLQVQELSETAQARFLLVYVPSKSHVYLPYLNDAESLARVFTDVPTLELDEAGFLQLTNQTATPELTRQHMDDQAHLMADFAAELGIYYLDLTPYFQEEASKGAELYYPFDTHWNQLGQDLAAVTIGTYVENHLAVTGSEEPGK